MNNWRDELNDAIKSKAEREAEDEERRRNRLEQALLVAVEALERAGDGLRFTHEQLTGKQQPANLSEGEARALTLTMHDLSLTVSLSDEDAVLKVALNDGRLREFDFSKDRHLSPKDVEEYVGRRAVEFARAAQKTHPW